MRSSPPSRGALRDAVRRALTDHALHDRVRALRDECDAMAPVAEAVAALEQLGGASA